MRVSFECNIHFRVSTFICYIGKREVILTQKIIEDKVVIISSLLFQLVSLL